MLPPHHVVSHDLLVYGGHVCCQGLHELGDGHVNNLVFVQNLILDSQVTNASAVVSRGETSVTLQMG